MDRGAVVRELGRLELAELAVDEPGAGEVVVRLEATGVCHTDLHVLQTGFGHPLPVLLGHEGAGVVEAVGEGVELPVGERVVLGWRSPCGECRWCARGDERRCRTPPRAARRLRANGDKLFQTLQLGTFATRTVVHESAAIRIPDGLPPEQACVIGCAVATGVGSVLETAQVWEGARVARDRLRRGRPLGGAGSPHRRRGRDLRARPRRAEARGGAAVRRDAYRPRRAARLRLRRRRPARDGDAGPGDARPRRNARLHRPAAAGRARRARAEPVLRQAHADPRLARRRPSGRPSTSRGSRSGRSTASSTSPGW